MDGLTTTEIAQRMGCVVRTIERRIERIRMIWEAIGEGPDE
jgi:DNA-directed RNA polymerase specialized sigma24 family protein